MEIQSQSLILILDTCNGREIEDGVKPRSAERTDLTGFVDPSRFQFWEQVGSGGFIFGKWSEESTICD